MVATVQRNPKASYAAAPLVREVEVGNYLGGRRSHLALYEQIPPGIIVRRGFWLLPSRKVSRAAIHLVSMQIPSTESGEPPVLVFRSPKFEQCYFGIVKFDVDGSPELHPHWLEDFPPLRLDQLQYIGQVVAGR